MRVVLIFFHLKSFGQTGSKLATVFFAVLVFLLAIPYHSFAGGKAMQNGGWVIEELPAAHPAADHPAADHPAADDSQWDIGSDTWPDDKPVGGHYDAPGLEDNAGAPRQGPGTGIGAAHSAALESSGAALVGAEIVELDLYDVWRMALGHHEAVAIAGEDLRQSALEIDRAYANFLPVVETEARYKRYTRKETVGTFVLQPSNSKRYKVGVTQHVYSGGRATSYYRRAKHDYRSEKYGFEDTRQRVVMDASIAFYDHLNAQQKYEVKRASLQRAQEQLRVAVRRYELGVGIRADVLRGEAELASKGVDLQKAMAEYDNTLANFRRLTGFEGLFTISGDYRPSTVDMKVEELIKLALKKRRDYLGKKAREESAKEGIKYAKSNFMPYLDLEGSYIYDDQDPASSIFTTHSAYGMLTFTLPVFEGGLRRAELKQARSRRRKADLERLGARRDVELEVRRAYTDLYSALTIVRLSEKELDFAAENYRMVFGRFRLGLASSTEVIDAETTLISAEIGIYSARDGYELAVLELKRSSGILLDEVNARVK